MSFRSRGFISPVIVGIVLSGMALFVYAGTVNAQCTQTSSSVECVGTDPDGFSSTDSGLTVTVDKDAVVSNGAANTIYINSNGNTITNDGTVTSGADAIKTGDNSMIVNNGTVVSTGTSHDALEVENYSTIINNGDLTATESGLDGNDNSTLINNGTVNADDAMQADDDNTVTNNGEITATNHGILLDKRNTVSNTNTINADRDGIHVDIDNTITNTGDITAGDDGIQGSNGNTITNAGTITAGDDGAFTADNSIVINTGTISGGDDGIQGGRNNTIVNTGEVTGADDGVIVADNSTIQNSGTITGNTGLDLDNWSGDPEGSVIRVHNTGTITGTGGTAIQGSSGIDLITTTGTVNGGISTIGGNDTVTAGGHISGLIDGGDDFDTLVFSMDVGADQFDAVMADLGALIASEGSVTINGETYTWTNFEALRNWVRMAMLRDRRLNAFDFAAPEALYCAMQGGFEVYDVHADGSGEFAFWVSYLQARTAYEQATLGGQNVLITSDAASGASLWALASGDFKFVGRDGYEFVFAGNSCAISD